MSVILPIVLAVLLVSLGFNYRQRKNWKAAYRHTRGISEYLWEKHFKEDSPNWEPFKEYDLNGVLSQIDNMACGLTRKEPR